jgi:hypothetical protein
MIKAIKINKVSISALLLFVFVFSPISSLYAYTITNTSVEARGDFVLEPGKVEVFVNPGETITKNIAVISRLNSKTDFKITIEDFIGSQSIDSPVVLLGDDSSPYSFKKNISPEIDSFSLSLGQRIQIPVTISVPADANPGGYYSSVIVSNVPVESPGQENVGQTKIISRLGLLVFIRVNGPVDETGFLEDFRISGSKFKEKSPVLFEILYRNTGNVHLVPYGKISIKNTFGRDVGSLPVDAYFSMPDSLRYREIEWNRDALFGRYTATLELSRGYENLSDTKQVVFWIIPWKIISIVFVVILMLCSVVYFVTRKFEFRRKE